MSGLEKEQDYRLSDSIMASEEQKALGLVWVGQEIIADTDSVSAIKAAPSGSTLQDTAIAPKLCKTVEVKTRCGQLLQMTIEPDQMVVFMPDMFCTIMAVEPIVNSSYASVKLEAEEWLFRELNADETLRKRIRKTSWWWFAAAAAPHASKEDLKVLVDWGNWVFPWDDPFDNGSFRGDPTGAKKMLDNLMSIMRGEPQSPKNALVIAHNDIWRRIVESASEGKFPCLNVTSHPKRDAEKAVVQKRYAASMELYCSGALEGVGNYAKSRIPGLEEYIDMRRRSVAVLPIVCMIEFAMKIEVPDIAYNDKSLVTLRRILDDVVFLQNDMMGYAKEERECVTHNVISILRNLGMTTQEAFDKGGLMLRERELYLLEAFFVLCRLLSPYSTDATHSLEHGYRDWHIVQADLPSWGEAVDREVQKYIAVVHSCMVANLNWHHQSHRYFATYKDMAREFGAVVVLEHPPTMSEGVN
ncbi:terpenoid synthase [Mollisia scopiformis]|uniref:Terpene synthase n=1 Tax=Mollisia scopiformis TaxID=149040 RepID=A0A194XGN4_MOLSC|nr:terpenoid synthase [Mollisia scopiformis]KUJ19360.1 terpenoid synthase [Mollisia scopiformis]